MAALVRRRDRRRFPERPGARQVAYHFESLDCPATDRPMNAYYVEFETGPAGRPQPHQHGGVELIYLSSGRLAVMLGGDELVLDTGDSLYFDADRPHSYRRTGSKHCAAVVVTAPAGGSPTRGAAAPSSANCA